MIRASGVSVLVLLACTSVPGSVLAEPTDPTRSYASLLSREIKALSDQEVADLRAGRGMGFALAAELNGYPGPVHVLELADLIELGPAQLERTQSLHRAMQAEAVPLGERLIEQEAALDRLFATRSAEPGTLAAAVDAIAAVRGALRAVHLRYHLSMRDLLTPAQLRLYSELQGYHETTDRSGGHDPGAH